MASGILNLWKYISDSLSKYHRNTITGIHMLLEQDLA